MNRTGLSLGAAAVVAAVLLQGCSDRGLAIPEVGAPEIHSVNDVSQDSWSARVALKVPAPLGAEDFEWFAPVHATLSPAGHVMLFGFQQNKQEAETACDQLDAVTVIVTVQQLAGIASPVQPGGEIPAANDLDLVPLPEDRQLDIGAPTATRCDTHIRDWLFCSGHTLLADGDLFAVGGLRSLRKYTQQSPEPVVTNLKGGSGLRYASIFDWSGTGGTWARHPVEMKGDGGFQLYTLSPFQLFMPAVTPTAAVFDRHERYYPTATMLPSGKVLVTAGTQILEWSDESNNLRTYQNGVQENIPITGALNLSVETFDPAPNNPADTWTLISHHELPMGMGGIESPPTIFNGDYTHAYVLPDPVTIVNETGQTVYDVIMFGRDGVPVLLRTTPPYAWHEFATTRPLRHPDPTIPGTAYPNRGASSLLLPIRLPIEGGGNGWGYNNGSVFMVGGDGQKSTPPSPLHPGYRRQFDVFDPVDGDWLWTTESEGILETERHHPGTVLLPDGKILVVTGHNTDSTDEGLRHAVYVDPRNGFSVAEGASVSTPMPPMEGQVQVRGYHSVTLLLPDGRVLVGGGQAGSSTSSLDKEKANIEILAPPYYYETRPIFAYLSSNQLYYGGEATTAITDQPIAEAVLIALGSMTHSVDMNQRYVQLQATSVPGSDGWHTHIVPPADGQTAPPGYYMLFLLNGNLVPSTARIVRVRP